MAEVPQPGNESGGYRLVSVPDNSVPDNSEKNVSRDNAGTDIEAAAGDSFPGELSHEGHRFRYPAVSGGGPSPWPPWLTGKLGEVGHTGQVGRFAGAPAPEAAEPPGAPGAPGAADTWDAPAAETGWEAPEAGVVWETPEPSARSAAWGTARAREPWEAPDPWETPAPWEVPAGGGPADGDQGGGQRTGRRRWGWLAVIAALALVVGGLAAMVLSRPGGRPAPAAAGSTQRTAVPSTGMSLKAAGSPGAGATPGMPVSPAMSTGAMMSARPSPSASEKTSKTGSPSMGMAASTRGCTSEQQGNGHQGPTTLTGVLADAGKCSVPRGVLPQQRCKPQAAVTGSQIVVCKSPIPQIARVSFYTYSSLAALYAAYTNEVAELSGRGFGQDTRTCGNTAVPYAETGWNHQELHPRTYTVAEMAAGKVPQLSAMGRMACFAVGQSQDIIWTTDVGLMLAVAQGTGSPLAVYSWWAEIHHVIIFPGTDMCGMPGRMESVPLGNLIEDPVCPGGAGK